MTRFFFNFSSSARLLFEVLPHPVNMSSSPFAKFLPGSFSNHGRHIGIIDDRLESSENNGMGLSTLIEQYHFVRLGNLKSLHGQ